MIFGSNSFLTKGNAAKEIIKSALGNSTFENLSCIKDILFFSSAVKPSYKNLETSDASTAVTLILFLAKNLVSFPEPQPKSIAVLI